MRAVVQRVKRCSVDVVEKCIAKIDQGLLVFIGIEASDVQNDIDYIIKRVVDMRIFEDEQGKMNLNVEEKNGNILIVSQFTLYGDMRKGRRPSFSAAASPENAKEIYEQLVNCFKSRMPSAEFGEFAAEMSISLINDGPVTILLDSKKLF